MRDQSSEIVGLAGKDFQNSGSKQNEKCPALVEVFNEKQASEYLTLRETFNLAKHARSLPAKTIESCLKVVLSISFSRRRGKSINGGGLTLCF